VLRKELDALPDRLMRERSPLAPRSARQTLVVQRGRYWRAIPLVTIQWVAQADYSRRGVLWSLRVRAHRRAKCSSL